MLPFNRFEIFAACAFAFGLVSVVWATELKQSQPVTLSYTPRWQPADWVVPPLRQPAQPAIYLPTASEFGLYEALPELDLELDSDLDRPQRGKATVGGWIQIGFHSGRLGQ